MPVRPRHDHAAALGTFGLVAAAIQLPASVDVGARIEGVLEEILQGGTVGPTPDQLPFAGGWPLPDAYAQPDVVARQIPQESAQRAQLLELRKDEPYHCLDLFVGVELDGAVGIPDVANG